MDLSRKSLALALIAALALPLTAPLSAKKNKKDKPSIVQMDESKRAAHVLNRFAFGPRAGDVERVSAMGVDKWFEQQLDPERIPDAAVEARLQPFRTLRMDTREMVENFPSNQLIKQVADGKMGLPRDSSKRAIYESRLDAYREKREEKAASNEQMMPAKDAGKTQADGNTPREANADERARAREDADRLLTRDPKSRFDAVLHMDPEQRRMMVRSLREDDRQRLVSDMSPEQRETLLALANPEQVVTNELVDGKILRAAYSERQLQEVMTDFWFNHFNVFIGKGQDRYMITSYERDVIRKHALGKFEDLLLATAKSPAMLFYLDNFQSVGPDSPAGLGQGAQQRNMARRNSGFGGFGGIFGGRRNMPMQQRFPRGNGNSNAQKNRPKRGLNENYAREVMELHTLGVDGGYTQKDVTELAKVFTGWTLREPRQGGDYEFNERMHEPGTKVVLGKKIKEDGENEGKKMLEILARHPSTAHFISRKLATRFVADNPPASLVDRMADTFLHSKGDIKEVLRTMFRSPEFWSPEAYRAKVKTPFEFVVSAVRVTGAEVKDPAQLARTLQRMGMPLYGMQPPTGYSSKADAWVNSSALLNRMNFALGLAGGKMRGIDLDPQAFFHGQPAPNDPDGEIRALSTALLGGDISPQTHDTILKQLNDASAPQQSRQAPGASQPGVIAGLLLGSPEFQRR